VSIHLIGGGWRGDVATDVYGPFVKEALSTRGRVAYVLQQGTPGGRFEDLLRGLGIERLRRITIGRDRLLHPDALVDVDALFVCGGVNPVYANAMRPAAASIRRLILSGMPYAGFSAGAVIAADRALLGGWTRTLPGGEVAVCARRRSEGLEELHVAPGLGLLPFSVDVHGTKWGTVTRALHAIEGGMIDECLMVDEDTVAVANASTLSVHGAGWVYQIRRHNDEAIVKIFRPGDKASVVHT
jgi:cyanophycinase